jgi:hypothetical protein
MKIVLNFENGTSTTTDVANYFTSEMITDCFVGKDHKGYGFVKSWVKHG